MFDRCFLAFLVYRMGIVSSRGGDPCYPVTLCVFVCEWVEERERGKVSLNKIND